MSRVVVRVSEDTRRPMGQAIITVAGLPRRLETCEFALRRHGCFANHLGPHGWQGAECWLAPAEAWYLGETLQFVLDAEQAYQLENMPYELALRGQGLDPPVATTFIWPLELAVEAGSDTEPRQILGGAQVRSQPQSAPSVEPASAEDRPPAAAPSTATPKPEPVVEPAAPAQPAAPPAVDPVASSPAGSVVPAPPRASAWRLVLVLLALLTLASGGIAWWLADSPPVSRAPLAVSPTPPPATARTVALAPAPQPTPALILPPPAPPSSNERSTPAPASPADAPPQPASVKPAAPTGHLEQALEAMFQPDLQRELERELLRDRR